MPSAQVSAGSADQATVRSTAGDQHELATRRWRARPRLALALRAVAAVLPFTVSLGVTRLLYGAIGHPTGWVEAAGVWLLLAAAGSATVWVVDRATRRLLPLVALLRLSLVFPDAAPSRFRAALRTGTVAQLERRLEDARGGALGETPAEAARHLIELVAALSRHDRLTRGHAERVRAYARLIGEEYGLREPELDLLHWSALLHDVGKLAVPAEILGKPGALTDEEYEAVRVHSVAGAALVAPLAGWLGEWARAVPEHHERWDGRGYPNGLSGEAISLSARIVSVADVFDVITSPRSYKPAMSADDARREIARCAGTQFDPAVVRAFLNVGIGRLRLLIGPLAWLGQIRIVRDIPLAPVGAALTGAAAGVVAVATVAAPLAAPPAARPVAIAGAEITGPTATEPAAPVTVPVLSTASEGAAVAPTPRSRRVPEPSGEAADTPAAQPASEPSPPPVPAPDVDVLPPVDPSPAPEPAPAPAPAPEPAPAPAPPPTPAPAPPPPPPPPPVALDDAATTSEDTAVVVAVGANDGDGLTVTSATAPSHGAVAVVAGGIRFTPDADWSGTDTFTYTATAPGTVATAAVTVTVTPVADRPVAVDDVLELDEDQTGTISLLGNDNDPDGDALTVTDVDLSGLDGGIVTWSSDGQLTYVPEGGRSGTDTIGYTVSDGLGGSATASLVVTVAPQPDSPTAANDAFASDGSPVSVAAPGLVANDGDEDGDALTVVSVVPTGAPAGTLVVQPDGSLTYTPAIGFAGTEAWTYTLDDGAGRQATATVSFTVDPALVGDTLYLVPDGTLAASPNPAVDPEPDAAADDDTDPGWTVLHGGRFTDPSEELVEHPDHVALWSTGALPAPLTLGGPATLELWSSIAGLTAVDKDADISIWLQDCDAALTACTTLTHIDDIHVDRWNGGAAGWGRSDWSLGDVTHTVVAGRRLRLAVGFGHEDMWIAASGARPSALHLTTR